MTTKAELDQALRLLFEAGDPALLYEGACVEFTRKGQLNMETWASIQRQVDELAKDKPPAWKYGRRYHYNPETGVVSVKPDGGTP